MSGGNGRFEVEELMEYIDDLQGKLVIVEGKKDAMALKSLGVKNIISLNGRPLHELALHVSKSLTSPDEQTGYDKGNTKAEKRDVVILTDFDSEGKMLAAKLGHLLSKHKVSVNSRLRRKFMHFGKNRIEDLNDLKGLGEGDIHVKVSSNFNKIRYNRKHKGQRCD